MHDNTNAPPRPADMKSFTSRRSNGLLTTPLLTRTRNDSDLSTTSSSASGGSLDGSMTTDTDEIDQDDSANTSCVQAPSGRRRQLLRRQSSLQEASMHLTAGTLASIVVVAFSLFFPFFFTPTAAKDTYKFAFWQYDPQLSHFDNTAWTYGTDYFLAVFMLLLGVSINVRHPAVRHAGWCSRGLLACYMFSVMAGGIAHQFYTSVEERNSLSFRILWTVCVGTVTAASGFMGITGNELLRLDHRRQLQQQQQPNDRTNGRTSNFLVPIVPDWFWIGYAVSVTATVAYGGFSCHRPACDIFIAGITQFPSTFYVIAIMFCQLRNYPQIRNMMRCVGCVGFILNAPLLPLYPILIQYTDWSLASVNTLLHSWLLVAWSLQGLSLRHVMNAVVGAASLSSSSPYRKRD